MIKINNILSVVIFSMVLSVPSLAQVNKNNLDQNADQTQGNYAATNLNYLGGVGSLGMMQSAWKDPLQHMGEGQLKPGYSKYYWTPDLVLPVRVREGMYTLINFPSWEVVENVYLGDGQSFTAQIQGPSSLMVYPDSSQFVGVDTNMIVFGRSGNKYVFYVQSETVNTDRITNAIIDIEVVNKNKNAKYAGANGSGSVYGNGSVNSGMPGGEAGVDATYTRDLQKEDWIEKIPVDPTQFRFDIEVYVPNPDDIIIAPERVWRDNIFTYIDLGEKALTAVQRPIVTLIVERSETPVGFRAAGPNNRLIIVEGMGDMVLRSGKRMVCLKLRRADSDGLENTVYAKSNEWDLQSSYASNPENAGNNGDVIEDVYGQDNEKNDKSSFFDFSSFFADEEQNKSKENRNNQASLNLSANVDVNGIPQGFISDVNTNNQKQPTNDSVNININSIPKVVPQTIPQNAQSNAVSGIVSNNKNPSVNEINLEGEYDINIDGSKIVVPEYNNNPKVDGNVNINIETQEKGKKLGNSNNNSSPVLISNEKSNAKSVDVSTKTNKIIEEFKNNLAYDNRSDSSISIELGTDENVNNLEKLWSEISRRYSATIGKYQPFYSVDTPADGQGKEVFHLRVGPINSLEDGDDICSQLGRNGIFCSVVRIQ